MSLPQPYFQDSLITLYCGDCRDLLPLLSGVTTVVTDPPYELGFMGKDWDKQGVSFDSRTWELLLNACLPGAPLLAFGGTRTHHRIWSAIEDAGWEIRDTLMFLYGSGFPKSLDISKAIDKVAGAEREIIGKVAGMGKQNPEWNGTAQGRAKNSFKPEYDLTAPATDPANEWQGYGTAVKPAHEEIVFARRPLTIRQEQPIIVASLLALEVQLWSLLPVSVVAELSGLSLQECAEMCASAQWSAADKSATQAALSGQMDMSQSVTVLTSCLNTVRSWRLILAESCSDASLSTISTETSETIDWKTLNSCLSGLTPLAIIQAAMSQLGSWWLVLPAARYFNAVVASIYSTLERSAAESAMSRARTSHLDATEFSPSFSPICLAMKPLDGTFAHNALTHGVAGLNIDGCRIEAGTDYVDGGVRFGASAMPQMGRHQTRPWVQERIENNEPVKETHAHPQGRWPANLLLDEEAARMLDEQSGILTSGNNPAVRHSPKTRDVYGLGFGDQCLVHRGTDSGGASRFFYTAKASRAERDHLLDGIPQPLLWSSGTQSPGTFQSPNTVRAAKNDHPTVKPLDLMVYLVKLVLPPKNGVVLDPFMGSGTTGLACQKLGVRFIGIDNNERNVEIAAKRMAQGVLL